MQHRDVRSISLKTYSLEFIRRSLLDMDVRPAALQRIRHGQQRMNLVAEILSQRTRLALRDYRQHYAHFWAQQPRNLCSLMDAHMACTKTSKTQGMQCYRDIRAVLCAASRRADCGTSK